MATTIQISEDLQKELTKRKLYDKETYEDVIWNILEDTMELSEETKRNIMQAEKEFKEGKYHTFDAVKKRLGWK
ncbi:MAG: hypothetical protein Q7R96_02645 [Nanoarchaeota archaeon]|nr:hypothetical protein [Nanoarchaeota archaeon]